MKPNLNGNALEAEPIEEISTSSGTDARPTEQAAAQPPANPWVTRADALKTSATSKKPLILLGGGVGVAGLLFVLTTFAGKSPKKLPTPLQNNVAQSSTTERPKGSVTPVMDTVRTAASSNTGGQLTAADINRTKATTGAQTGSISVSPAPRTNGTGGATLASVPPFDSTQQRWEEPKPYGEAQVTSQFPSTASSQNLLKEASLVFVRKAEVANANSTKPNSDNDVIAPQLSLTTGTRIQARLETQVSSATTAPVVAVVEYTYSLGEHVVIPAGARVYGQLQQADRSGAVSINFTELELLDGNRLKIEAIGTSLELGPIKGSVSGKNTGRNFLVRTASGIGSVAAMLVGNNTSGAFSEDDMIRERIAQNIGNAGDTEVMNMALTNRIVVSVPADTPIYIVFTKREAPTATSRPPSNTNQ